MRYDKDFSEIQYYIIADYKPGTIKIAGITICETVFDYLENIGILDTFAFFRTDAFIHRGVIRGQEMYQIERNLLKKMNPNIKSFLYFVKDWKKIHGGSDDGIV